MRDYFTHLVKTGTRDVQCCRQWMAGDNGRARGLEFQLDDQEIERGHLLRPTFYWHLIKRRALYFLIPFVLVLAGGLAGAALWPASYEAAGKILVESQQIPTELVRPTVTNSASERIQVIGQRTMTRDNLLSIIDKFQLYPERRSLLSASQLVDLLRKDIRIEPVALPLAFAQSRRDDNPTIAFTVTFEASRAGNGRQSRQ